MTDVGKPKPGGPDAETLALSMMTKGPKLQTSTIDRLPKELRLELQQLLRDPKVTQRQATDHINQRLQQQGYKQQLSVSSVSRYRRRMRQVAEQLDQSYEIAQLWSDRLGDAPDGQLGALANQILRTLSFDVTLMLRNGGVDAENAPAVVDMLKNLSLVTQRLESAANLNHSREREIRREALEEAAQQVKGVASSAGVSEEAMRKIHQALGL